MICGLAMKANWKLAQISRELDIPASTVGDVVRKYRDHGIKTVQPRSGRPRKLTERDLRHVAISARRNPFDPIGIHQQNLTTATGNVSLATVRQAFQAKGFFSFRPALKPFLSYRNRLRRKIWVNDKINWTVNDWSKVIWSDESRFALRHNDGGVRVVRKFGERLHKRFVLPTFKFGKTRHALRALTFGLLKVLT